MLLLYVVESCDSPEWAADSSQCSGAEKEKECPRGGAKGKRPAQTPRQGAKDAAHAGLSGVLRDTGLTEEGRGGGVTFVFH